jgi:hypothetical protein
VHHPFIAPFHPSIPSHANSLRKQTIQFNFNSQSDISSTPLSFPSTNPSPLAEEPARKNDNRNDQRQKENRIICSSINHKECVLASHKPKPTSQLGHATTQKPNYNQGYPLTRKAGQIETINAMGFLPLQNIEQTRQRKRSRRRYMDVYVRRSRHSDWKGKILKALL